MTAGAIAGTLRRLQRQAHCEDTAAPGIDVDRTHFLVWRESGQSPTLSL